MTDLKLLKLALHRDPTVPEGQPAPYHLLCPCGTPIQITAEQVECPTCQTLYDKNGWTL